MTDTLLLGRSLQPLLLRPANREGEAPAEPRTATTAPFSLVPKGKPWTALSEPRAKQGAALLLPWVK